MSRYIDPFGWRGAVIGGYALIVLVSAAFLAVRLWWPSPDGRVAEEPSRENIELSEVNDPIADSLPPAVADPVPALSPVVRPKLVIIIDDMGVDRRHSQAIARLPGPLTLSFLPYAEDLPSQTEAARQAGHELMLHMPMEPQNLAGNDPGHNALLTGLEDSEISRRIDWNLSQFQGYAGVNNHMGSRATQDVGLMNQLMTALSARGLFFVDSRTTAGSLGAGLAAIHDVRFAERDVFLDDGRDRYRVERQLDKAVALAKQQGRAIVIGHPYPETIAALRRFLPAIADQSVELVPASSLFAPADRLAIGVKPSLR